MFKKAIGVLAVLAIIGLASGYASGAADTPPDASSPTHREGYRPDAALFQPLPFRTNDVRAMTQTTAILPWSKIVFQSYRDSNWEIYTANDDGSGEIRLTAHSASDSYPRFNRGATRIAFTSNRTGNYDLFVMNADGSALTQLTTSPASDHCAAWSPDGSRIAFHSNRDGQYELYVMNADGSNQTRLTAGAGYDVEPSWSPDSERIAFRSNRNGSSAIWVMNADGSEPVLLATQPYAEHPVWSPDGSQIAYDADGDGDGWQEVWVMNADGSNQRQVYKPAGTTTDAWVRSWSPDSRYIAFTQITFIYYEGEWYWLDGYLRAWDSQLGNTLLLNGSDTEWYPDWRTIDAVPPESALNPLPAESPAPIQISWFGADVGMSGLRDYDVQVKDGVTGDWTDWQSQATDTSVAYYGIGGHTYYFRIRARDNAGNVEAWPAEYSAMTTVEARPPQSHVEPLSEYTHDPDSYLDITWSGYDPGNSGIQSYDIQYRDGPDGTWIEWISDTASTGAFFHGEEGHTYYFRSRARDYALNVEDWPEGDGDTMTTLFGVLIAGTTRDNTDTPIAGATITTTPEFLHLIRDDSLGLYQVCMVEYAYPYYVSMEKEGYGSLPAAQIYFDASVMEEFDAVLPPANDVIINGGFEATPDATENWMVNSSQAIPPIEIILGYAGNQALQIGRSEDSAQSLTNPEKNIHYSRRGIGEYRSTPPNVSNYQAQHTSLTQVISVPETTPTLSFLYQLGGALPGNELTVSVDNGITQTQLLSITEGVWSWTHIWSSLAPWAGQTITLSFNILQGNQHPPAASLDEISVGSAYPDLWISKSAPVARPGESLIYHITYGNRGGATAENVRIADLLPADLAFVSANPQPRSETSGMLPVIVWEAGDIPAKSGPFSITITTTVPLSIPGLSTLTNTVSITSTTPELESANNTASVSSFVGHQIYLPVLMKQ